MSMNLEEFKNKYQKVDVIEFPNKVLELMPEPMVSVRVSTYLHAKYIRQCLDGILMQKANFPFEILIGEDDSSDGNKEICIEYAKQHPGKIRLFLHKRENNIKLNGKPSAKFQGLYTSYHCRGKYIAVIEGDDFWTDPQKLQKQIDYMEGNLDCSFTCHDVDIVYEDVPEVFPFQTVWTKNIVNFEDVFKHHFIPFFSLIYRKRDVENLPDWMVNTIVGDIPLSLILASHGYGFYFTEKMGTKRKNPGGITQDPQRAQIDLGPNFYYIYKKVNDYTNGRYKYLFEPKFASYERSFARKSLKNFKLVLFVKNLVLATFHEPDFLVKKILGIKVKKSNFTV
jgi:glycosyltransferase involved in cell wall biosynthesis